MHLTIAYITSRINPHFEWFWDSLWRESGGNLAGIRVIVVTFYDQQIPHSEVQVVRPKPCTVQGPHRLTKKCFFAASNARNTALCLAPDGWLAYVDDLSVILPGWLARVREAMKTDKITLGRYRKARNLVVMNGLAISADNYPAGRDSREYALVGWPHMRGVLPAPAEWFFGCSLVGPVEAFLKVNGWPETFCDGMGYEDAFMGMGLHNAGVQFLYDPQMRTVEAEDLHHVDTPLIRWDPGVSPKDKSHAVLDKMKAGCKWFDQPFGDIRALRQSIMAGGQFPIPTTPTHEWFTSKPLNELPEGDEPKPFADDIGYL